MTTEEFDSQLEAANRRGLESDVGEIHALAARYNRDSEQLVLELRGGLRLLVPVHLLQGVAGQAPELIERVEVQGRGSALHWEELDADFSVQGIAAGSFGSRSWMQSLEEGGLLDQASIERRRKVDALQPTAASMGRKGGAVRSQTKAASARANGAKGGRPRKQPTLT